jgi:translation initiation factor IF-1
MVKNMQGGSKTKGQARKLSSSYSSRSATRLSTNNLEIYACVVKHFGQGRCSVRTVDDKELLCIIRNKFKGRSRRNNTIEIGSIILAGLREWEGPDNYKNCDVLEVYDQEDNNHLRSIPSTKIHQLDKYNISFTGSESQTDENFLFTNEPDDKNTRVYKIDENKIEENQEHIDIEDI